MRPTRPAREGGGLSKKGPRSQAFGLLTSSLSDDLVARYLEIAHYVREQELARRREMERLKAAARRQKQAEEEARLREALKAAGLLEPEEPAGRAAAVRSGRTPATRRKRGKKDEKNKKNEKIRKAGSGPPPVEATRLGGLQVAAPEVPEPAPGVPEPPPSVPEAAPAVVQTVPAPPEAVPSVPEAEPQADEPEDLPNLGTPKPSRRRKPITREDILKLAIADDLGYLDKVRKDGWGGLTTAESGRVGGMMTRRMKRLERGLPPV